VVRADEGWVEVQSQGHGGHRLDTARGVGEPELPERQAKQHRTSPGDGGRHDHGDEHATMVTRQMAGQWRLEGRGWPAATSLLSRKQTFREGIGG
jgi:hypothetical protein